MSPSDSRRASFSRSTYGVTGVTWGAAGVSSVFGSRDFASAISRSSAVTSALNKTTSGYFSLNWERSRVSSCFKRIRRASGVSLAAGGPPGVMAVGDRSESASASWLDSASRRSAARV